VVLVDRGWDAAKRESAMSMPRSPILIGTSPSHAAEGPFRPAELLLADLLREACARSEKTAILLFSRSSPTRAVVGNRSRSTVRRW
jgi:hypothetical protein